MKRKVTYLLKDFDAMMKVVLSHTKDIKSQAELLKNKEIILKEVDKMSKKYDKIITDILERDEESENEIQI
jgi:DNA repair ATPase RecN